MLQGRRLPPGGPARRFSCTNGSQGLVSDAIQTTARIAGSLLARKEVHDEVVAMVEAVGRSGFLRTGNRRRFRSVGYPCGGEL